MKYLKLAALAVLCAAILALVFAWLRRDSIARDIANAVLEGSDIVVSDLSVRRLQTDRAEFSEIVLRRADGTEIEIAGLAFPLSFPSVRPEHVAIEEVRIIPAADGTGSVAYAEPLGAVLDLSESMPSTAVTIGKLSAPTLPEITDIVWAVTPRMQRLSLSVGPVSGVLELERMAGGRHRTTLRASPEGVDALAFDLEIAPLDAGFEIGGSADLDLAPWLPVLGGLGLLSAAVESLAGRLEGTLEIRVEADGPVVLKSRFSPSVQPAAQYRAGEALVELRTVAIQPADVRLELPDMAWAANFPESEILLRIDDVGEFAAEIENLECGGVPTCAADIRVDAGALEVADLAIGSLSLVAAVEVNAAGVVSVDIRDGLDLVMSGLSGPGFSADTITVAQVSGARLRSDREDWRIDADSLTLGLERLRIGETLTASLPLTLSALRITDGGDGLRTELSMPAEAGTLSWSGLELLAPGLSGILTLGGDAVQGRFDLSAGGESLRGGLSLTYDRTTAGIRAVLTGAELAFDRRRLSGWFADWPHDWDIVAGRWAVDGDVLSSTDGYSGSMTLRIRELAGMFGDIAFAGVGAEIAGGFDSTPSVTVSTATAGAGLVDIGLPLEDVSARFSVAADRTVRVDALSMSVLGGTLTADPFTYTPGRAQNEVALRPRAVQLQFIADLAGFEAIELDGTISGMLPATIAGTTVTIDGGTLQNDPPGGVIRYAGAAPIDAAAPGSGLTVVSRALSNFEFDSLRSDVNYTEEGDLSLQMRLTGINPDLDPNQPINLNLSIENNIPQLLRSLQAVRSIEDVLERQTEN